MQARTGRLWRYSPSKLPGNVMNPIGAGDAVASGTLLAWTADFITDYRLKRDSRYDSSAECEEDADAVDAFRWGLACGAASCLTTENSKFSLTDASQIYDSTVVTLIP